MTVPILVPWDIYLGKVSVWCECLGAGVRRPVLLPRLDTIFGPLEEDPARELPRGELEWRLISPTEDDWTRYVSIARKQADRAGVTLQLQRVEKVARWVGGRQVAVPQYHIWLYRDAAVAVALEQLYEELDPQRRRVLWQWLLAWTAPAEIHNPVN